MAIKSIIFLLITLLVVVFVAPKANGQPVVIRINETVFCSLNASIVVNTTTPMLPFPNATIQLTISGTPILPTTTTNLQGRFNLGLIQSRHTSLPNLQSPNAKVVVTTPLSVYNSSLPPNTFLKSVPPLQLLFQAPTVYQLGMQAFKSVQI
uniref:phylloplanin-like n=1 Tax=Erigeron canadensis TaxID=72917 RepID=UPI001CB895B9|nr:phylloplanin-like [Erigeron canadensis]XP_043627053.1 phylloplanin-like [Erigeron canadensis]XP_043627055.1 phylloplanin-like [Erigeron canadensis]